jgi:hypothetical protein
MWVAWGGDSKGRGVGCGLRWVASGVGVGVGVACGKWVVEVQCFGKWHVGHAWGVACSLWAAGVWCASCHEFSQMACGVCTGGDGGGCSVRPVARGGWRVAYHPAGQGKQS